MIPGLNELLDHIDTLPFSEKVSALNEVKKEIHKISPFRLEPVDCVIWVPSGEVKSNPYNPNSVAVPEMRLLEVSILEDGYTQPIVTWLEDENREIIDGHHRGVVGKNFPSVKERVLNYLPVVTANENRTDKGDRIAATIRHNRARGKHRIDAMSEIVLELKRRNWSDKKIAEQLGMDQDEILRLSQIGGLAEMFADKEFSEAWEVERIDETDTLQIEEENQ
jgi:ParB-like chromosome segregation protein Spo0J